jgi:lysophospholipase L1-like esterase
MCLVGLSAACGSGVVVDGTEDPEDDMAADAAMTPDDGPNPPDQGQPPADMPIVPDMPAPDMQAEPDMPPDMVVEPDMQEIEGWPALYPADRDDSPITPSVRENLRVIAAKRADFNDDVFAKIGDSNTVNTAFMSCFAAGAVDLGGRVALNPTINFFRGGDAGQTTPYDRVSLAATVGWSASGALAGDPNPIDQELAAISPRFALVMFGTNDIQARQLYSYADQMLAITDQLIEIGALPILSTIPARLDDPAADLLVPRYNAVVRAIAQSRQIPLVDLHRALSRVPGKGLGQDGLHLNARGGGCDLGEIGVTFGQNVRNLLNVVMLDKLRTAVLEDGPAPDPAGAPLEGMGTSADPFVVPGLPFVHANDTSRGGQDMIDRYTGCNATQNEGGREFVYKLTITQPTTLRVHVLDHGDADIDVHLLDATGQPTGCLARNDREIVRAMQPGTYTLVFDTFVTAAGVERSGEFHFVLLAD